MKDIPPSVQHVAEHCRDVEYLNLSGCRDELRDEQVRLITESCKKLLSLDLSEQKLRDHQFRIR